MDNNTMPPFLKRKGDAILYNGEGEFIFYIPEIFFDQQISYFEGEYISTLGIMDYTTKINNKLSGLHTFNYPTRFSTKPYKVEKITDVKLIKESEPDDYRVLYYKKDDPIIVDIKVPQDIDNSEALIKLFIKNGHIPNTIPYDKIQEYFVSNYLYNGNKYSFSLQLFGIIISELCRSKKDIKVPFRLSKDNDMKNYKPISVKYIPKLISAYTSLTSENIDESIVFASLNNNKVQIPLERVLTGENIV